ncbi:MAG: hypothetical protein UX13_C0007G0012 [Candidatus Woesebacteria bacterium GW2011_GWB1_45_5]|uniref:RanBP2-type domain-containing protein n=1 Tax=Candidatus Woesebacteria bacterium GW2011_GWB1_45_5 TaxID=1618581 RepID=A0A0G1PYV6_9BACT|nr:MAG: hypothetical protein UX13_C0007G0012 [Candidatus Woesebacteria bacterium GW2011_GWB1_45_5]
MSKVAGFTAGELEKLGLTAQDLTEIRFKDEECCWAQQVAPEPVRWICVHCEHRNSESRGCCKRCGRGRSE